MVQTGFKEKSKSELGREVSFEAGEVLHTFPQVKCMGRCQKQSTRHIQGTVNSQRGLDDMVEKDYTC